MSPQTALVSNDDGIDAAGILGLILGLSKSIVSTSLYVCCPVSERSTQSQALTVGKPIKVEKRQVEGSELSYAVDGTPADCLALALNSSLFSGWAEFDVVVSGINRGENLGWHSHYSGTLAIARQAVFSGKIGLAFSLDNLRAKQLNEYDAATRLSVPVVQLFLGEFPLVNGYSSYQEWKFGLLGKLLLSVNIPNLPFDAVKGYYLTFQGNSCNFSQYRVVEQPDDGEITFRASGVVHQEDVSTESDYWVIKQGWVSIVPLSLCQSVICSEEEKKQQIAVLNVIVPLLKQMSDVVGKQFKIAQLYQEMLDGQHNQLKDTSSLC